MSQFKLVFVILFINILSLKAIEGQNQGLTSASVSEGSCIPNLRSRGSKNGDPGWSGTLREYYVPIASEGCYRSYAEALLGRSAKSQEELDSMKLRIKLNFLFPPVFYSYGFNGSSKYFRQTCPPLALNQILCLPLNLFSSPGTNTSGIRTSIDTVVLQDNKTFLLIVRCLNNKIKDYKVLTTKPTVPLETQKLIADKIQELGFDLRLLRVKSY